MSKWNIAVMGLGFIGLPLSLSYAMKGANVIGLEINDRLVNEINNGESNHLEYYEGKSLEEILKEQLAIGNYRAVNTTKEMKSFADYYIITVGVDVKEGDPQMAHLQVAMEYLAKILKKGDLVLLRSTVIPGTTEDVVKPILEESGLKAGEDFYLAYSSERIAEGKAFEEFRSMPLAVGGINAKSLEKATELLQLVTNAPVHKTEIKVVETAKIIENVQRDVNIAMVQEISRLAEAMGIDTYELIKTANTHSRVNLLTPGPGVGGYCLPNALYYLLPKAAEYNLTLPLLRKAREINDGVPQHIVTEVINALTAQGKPIKGAKVAVLGLAMKDFSNDDRISPPHDIVELFIKAGLQVAAYDPAVPNDYSYKVNALDDAVRDADALVYLTVQEEFLEINWSKLISKMNDSPIVYDSKNRVPLSVREQATLIRM